MRININMEVIYLSVDLYSRHQRVDLGDLRALEGTLSRWSRLHLQSLAHANSHWARVVGYGSFSLRIIHKEGLCPSSRDINKLTMNLGEFWF
jgi:hypothetical protein